MTKEEIEKRLGCPIEKLPIGVTATIAVNDLGYNGTFDVLSVVVMQGYIRPYIEFRFKYPSGKVGVSQCYIEDYGLTWAASIYDWEHAKRWRNEHE